MVSWFVLKGSIYTMKSELGIDNKYTLRLQYHELLVKTNVPCLFTENYDVILL